LYQQDKTSLVASNSRLSIPLVNTNTSFDLIRDQERNLAEQSASLVHVLQKKNQTDDEDTEDDEPPKKK
jgi:hypothetical protein